MNELSLQHSGTETPAVRTPAAIGAEVRNLAAAAKYLTLFYAVEIGRRLVEAKELVPHGEWLNWLKEETEFSQPSANRFMRLFHEYAADQTSIFGAETKQSTLNNLSMSNALRLLAVPADEREAFALDVDAEHLSSRELEAAIRERDEARRALQTTEARLADTQKTLSQSDGQISELRQKLEQARQDVKDADDQAVENERALQARIKELESRPIDVAVQEPDPEQVERLAAELANKAIAEAAKESDRRIKEAVDAASKKTKEAEAMLRDTKAAAKAEKYKLLAKVKAAEDKAREAEAKQKAAEEQAAAAGSTENAAVDAARAEAEELKKKLALSGEALTVFKLRFETWQTAYQAMREALGKVPEGQRERCQMAVQAVVAGWSA